ncbi:hypothetical protein Ccrd_026284 [Cynara cardunculus var. scolymus]|uniref:Uncharacterized protein n=1 Tax=Cynara cardunculus var. scolymus TaxID=59895 RepID=A0A118HQX0_CYNCS|nr:hypothetical protein Ccrd_026284 [Cynara cardunculus var. scolymus]
MLRRSPLPPNSMVGDGGAVVERDDCGSSVMADLMDRSAEYSGKRPDLAAKEFGMSSKRRRRKRKLMLMAISFSLYWFVRERRNGKEEEGGGG